MYTYVFNMRRRRPDFWSHTSRSIVRARQDISIQVSKSWLVSCSERIAFIRPRLFNFHFLHSERGEEYVLVHCFFPSLRFEQHLYRKYCSVHQISSDQNLSIFSDLIVFFIILGDFPDFPPTTVLSVLNRCPIFLSLFEINPRQCYAKITEHLSR